jgi:hypothetical protein
MICRNCKACYVGYDKNNPLDAWCLGVKHPFKIVDVNNECTEYFDGDQNTLPTWADLEFSVDTYTAPRFIMLVGIPGSGKSILLIQ